MKKKKTQQLLYLPITTNLHESQNPYPMVIVTIIVIRYLTGIEWLDEE